MGCECEFCADKPDHAIKSGLFVELEIDRTTLQARIYASCESEDGKVGKIPLGSSSFFIKYCPYCGRDLVGDCSLASYLEGES